MKNRVVVSGVGVIGCNGHAIGLGAPEGKPCLWQNVLAGRSPMRAITLFDASSLPTQIAGEVDDFNEADLKALLEGRSRKRVNNMGRNAVFGLGAGIYAMRDAGLKKGDFDPERFGVKVAADSQGVPRKKWAEVMAEAFGEVLPLDQLIPAGPAGFLKYLSGAGEALGTLLEGRVGPSIMRKLEGTWLLRTMPAGASIQLALEFDARGEVSTISHACAAGTMTIGDSFRLIRDGYADVMLAGGTDARITPDFLAGFNQLDTLSRRNDDPQKASRPFDRDRDGFVLSEGAAMVVLESLEHALRRGARIYGEMLGYGCRGDAYNITDPHPDGIGMVRAMQQALAEAEIDPSQVEYVSAHGSSTVKGDKIETRALKTVFGDAESQRRRKLAISSTKSLAGHLICATGSHEFVTMILGMAAGVIPPTVNYQTPDAECDLDWVPNQPRPQEIRIAMKNSLGFGGQNASCIVRNWLS